MPDDPMQLNPDSGKYVVCPACRFANPPENRYCGGCGSSLEPGASRAANKPVATERAHAERRQLTVLFCDLVGSSVLASRLDPEELSDVIRSYQDACRSVIERYDGTVTRYSYVGDAVLALFGYPRAHEDDAERAVRSGLDIISSVASLPLPGTATATEPLAVRIAIATGLVVAGDLVGEGGAEEDAIVGETPNLAARLQAIAVPNSVIISAGTRELIGERFACADLGEHSLRGFSEPVRAWRVGAPRPAESRFEASRQPVRTAPLVGREEHLSRLLRLWQEMGPHRGRAVLLSGEAGIGKSRVVEALRERIAGTPHTLLRYQCSPHYFNTALHPVIEHIERAAGIGREDAPSIKLAKLSAWPGAAPDSSEAVALLGALLSIPPDPRFPLPGLSAQRQKERTFGVLLDFMRALAAVRPLLLVFEDAHWIDPTTQEFLTLLIERVREMRAFVIITFRPDYSPPWRQMPFIEHLELAGLSPEHAMGLARHVAGERRLSEKLIEEVVGKTDGVPLFVEEFTRAVLGAGLPDEREDRAGPGAPRPLLAVPSTLQDSLMARLDQLGPAKHVAQVAGAIGREFNYELLEAVWRDRAGHLHEGLVTLVRSGLVHAQSGVPGASYAFKHALVQEVAYESLLRSSRRELHLRIAEALERRFPQTARDAPELVAHHWTAAGKAEPAIAGWLAAGRRASERSEYREAIGHLRTGLALYPQLPDAQARRDSELALLLALAPALITTEGGGTPEVGALYARALSLCEGTPESETHFVAHWGSWRASMDHRMGRERADKLLDLAQNLGEPALRLQAHHCQWATLYMLGAHSECCRHTEMGLKLYDRNRDHVHAGLYGGHDARVCALGERALARWMLGHPREALALVQSALDWSRELSHVGSRVHALDYALVLQKFRRDMNAVNLLAGELTAFASEQRLRVFSAKGVFFRGWAHALTQDVGAGLSEMLDGIASERAADTPHDFTLYLEMLAEVYGLAGRLEEALRAVGDAFAVAERRGIVYWNAELHRRRGELLFASGERDAAETCFREALACARVQEARSLELRAVVSLARFGRDQRDCAPVAAILRSLCESFGEDRDTPDLNEAHQVLESLG